MAPRHHQPFLRFDLWMDGKGAGRDVSGWSCLGNAVGNLLVALQTSDIYPNLRMAHD